MSQNLKLDKRPLKNNKTERYMLTSLAAGKKGLSKNMD